MPTAHPRGGRVIEAGANDVKQLNPALTDDVTSAQVSGKIYDPLVRPAPGDGAPMPWLATWSVSADGLTYSLAIEAKATWSDGRPITGNDFLARVKLQGRSKVAPNKALFQDIEGYVDYATGRARTIGGIRVDPADPKRFSVTFGRVVCTVLLNVFGAAPLPAHVFAKYIDDGDPSVTVDAAPENNAPPVASGPFVLREWRRGDVIELVRNDRYFKGAPYLGGYAYKVVRSTAEQVAALAAGEASLGVMGPADAAPLEGEAGLRLYEWTDNSFTGIGWRTRGGALADRRVRQALWYALDVDRLIAEVTGGRAERQLQPVNAASWAALPASQLDTYAYSEAKAADLLAQAGSTRGSSGAYERGGVPLAITIVTNEGNPQRQRLLDLAVEQYRRLGIGAQQDLRKFDELTSQLVTGTGSLDGFVVGWQLAPDPDPFALFHSSQVASEASPGSNLTLFTSERVDRLLEQGRYGPDCSLAARRAAYQELDRILNEEAPYVFGYAPHRVLAARAGLRGITTSPFYAAADFGIHEWWIAP